MLHSLLIPIADVAVEPGVSDILRLAIAIEGDVNDTSFDCAFGKLDTVVGLKFAKQGISRARDSRSAPTGTTTAGKPTIAAASTQSL